MENNLVVKILENREKQRDLIQKDWGMTQRRKLVEILENNGAYISENVWDLLLFNINALFIKNNQVGYMSFYKPSKKIQKLLKEYNKLIIDNFDYITKIN